MKGWCDNYRYASGEAYANFILIDICRPLRWWLNEQWEKSNSRREIELGIAFRAKADDIVMRGQRSVSGKITKRLPIVYCAKNGNRLSKKENSENKLI